MPTPRQFAFPSGIKGNIVCRWYGIAIVLAMVVARHNGSHDDVQWYASIAKTECTFENELTLDGHVRRFLAKMGDYVP